jgi:hypothetical protein
MAETAQQEEQLLDVRVAEASVAYKFYLNQERKILGQRRSRSFWLSGNWSATSGS